MNLLLNFFFSPTWNVDNLQKKSNNYKLLVIWFFIFISTLFNYLITPLGIAPLWFNVMVFITAIVLWILFNLLFVGVVYFVGKNMKPTISGNYVDNLFFIALSSLVFTLSPIANYLMIQWGLLTWAFIGVFFFLGWSLILMSKSLSKLNNISEWKVTFLVIGSVALLYALNSIVITPMLWISLF